MFVNFESSFFKIGRFLYIAIYKIGRFCILHYVFLDFSKGRNFSAVWHKAVINLGPLTEMFGVSGGIYFLVVDNSDNGWFKTDFDFVNDIAVYDIKLVYTPNQ